MRSLTQSKFSADEDISENSVVTNTEDEVTLQIMQIFVENIIKTKFTKRQKLSLQNYSGSSVFKVE
jgi:hypothetical protein